MKYNYLKKYIDFNWHQKYPQEREILHELIIDDYVKDKYQLWEKKIILTAGCYGAGKSKILKLLNKHKKIDLKKYVYIDPDKIRPNIPEYESYLRDNHFSAGYNTNKEVSYLSELITKHSLFKGYGIILDTSLRDGEWFMEYINWIKTNFADYKIIILYVDTTWIKILERNLIRGEVTRRCIPLKSLKESFQESPKSFELLKNIVDSYFYVDNNEDWDEEKMLSKMHNFNF